jgi:hypothetical protein
MYKIELRIENEAMLKSTKKKKPETNDIKYKTNNR